MNQNEIEKQTLFFKRYFNNIDFNLLYSNFENVYNEYSESDLINSHLNNLIDKFFLLNNKDEEIKLVFNFDFFKGINIDNLILSYTSEKNGKREKFIIDLVDNSSLKNIITPKNSLYTRNILLFILLKYYKQIGADFDRPTEEKLYEFLRSEMNFKDLPLQKESLNIFSNHIQSLYKILLKKNLWKKEENSHMPQINHVNSSVKIPNNLNDEFSNENKNVNNIIIIPNNNQLNNPNNELNVHDPREDAKVFFEKFLNFLVTGGANSHPQINNNHLNLNDEGNFKNLNLNQNSAKVDKSLINDGSRALLDYYFNELHFIHLNEFMIMSMKGDFNNDIYLGIIHLKILIGYFIWKNIAKKKGLVHFKYGEVINYLLKYSMTNLLEALVKFKDEIKDVQVFVSVLQGLYQIMFEVEFDSNEIYLFALLITLVIYIKFLKNKTKIYYDLRPLLMNFIKTHGITNINNSNSQIFVKQREKNYNENLNFLKTIVKDLNIDLSLLYAERLSTSVNVEDINLLNHSNITIHRNLPENYQLDYELLLLSKLLEFYMIKKYTKNLNDISDTISKVNTSDFIIGNLFVNEDIYDLINISYKNIKEKYFWNFSEIIYFIYNKYPKVLKHTILRHLKYCPSQESLLNQLVQYYYDNKDYKKCKSLIRKLMSREERTTIIKDIISMCLTKLIIILINEQKYGEALEIAIHNLERIKSRIKELNDEIKEVSFYQNNNQELNKGQTLNQNLQAYVSSKQKNVKDLGNDLILNNQILIRSYFLLGVCYDKIGESISTFDDKSRSMKSALSFFRLANDNIPDNLAFSYHLALEYYNLRLFDQAEDVLKIVLNSEKKYYFSTSLNYFYIYCLNILVNIANLKFDNAYQLIETVFFNDDVTNFKFYILKTLKFYILTYKLINYTEAELKEEDAKFLTNEIIGFFDSTLKQIDDEIETYKKKYTEINIIKNSILEENYFRICNYNKFDKLDNPTQNLRILDFNRSNMSKKKFNYEKIHLEKLRIEFIQIFYFLFDKLISNKFDNNMRIREFCKTFYSNILSKYKGDEEDISILLIKAIQSEFDEKKPEAEAIYKKILEICPSNMRSLKRYSRLLISKGDFSNAFIYLNKAIKLDSSESGLWSLLGSYYLSNKDTAKYYECIMKEIENSKYHKNSFLSSLMPKNI